MTFQILGFYFHYKYFASFAILGAILFCSFLRDPANCFKGIMSILSFVSVSDEFTGFSSAGGESTGRVVRT